jgi:hypothetical protein
MKPFLLVVHVTKTFYSQDDQRGTVRNVVFKDIAVTHRVTPASRLQGFDADHGVEGVVFDNMRFNGQAVTNAAAGQIAIGAHVRDVKFIVPAAEAAPKPPARPRILLDTGIGTTPVSGKAIQVAAGGDFQAAWNTASPGDEIVLQAGATYIGNFVLPAKRGSGPCACSDP